MRFVGEKVGMPFDNTIVALATPTGESALAIIRVNGPRCVPLVTELFGRSQPQPRYAYLGQYRERSGTLLDTVIYLFYAKGASYTGDPLLEISCHGNPFIVQKIIEDLLQRGCRMADPGEFTRIAFVNGKMDLSQAEAVIDLIHARSDKALEAAQKQLSGTVRNKVKQLIDSLLKNMVAIEAYIDFPEEDLPPEDVEGSVRHLQQIQKEMAQLIGTSHYSTLLHEGIKTVITGPPNVGKSSLFNALIGEERAIVSEEPGTTRDYIEDRIGMGPYAVRIIDTAGLHKPQSDIECLGINQTLRQVASADFNLLVLDSTAPFPTLPSEVISKLIHGRALVVENKVDLPESRLSSQFLPAIPHCHVSALTGEGIENLKETIQNVLEDDLLIPTQDAIIVSARHATALREAQTCLEAAFQKIRGGEAAELTASDLRGALYALGQITGEIDNEAMLDRLFSTFCIGK